MSDFENITTEACVAAYRATRDVFDALLSEVRDLSKKKPEATLSPGKVRIINRVLVDLLQFLESEPEGKYLEQLDDATLPQVSDALLIMVQFDAALKAFYKRYHRRVFDDWYWITAENMKQWDEEGWFE
jgi:hypothetical protein